MIQEIVYQDVLNIFTINWVRQEEYIFVVQNKGKQLNTDNVRKRVSLDYDSSMDNKNQCF